MTRIAWPSRSLRGILFPKRAGSDHPQGGSCARRYGATASAISMVPILCLLATATAWSQAPEPPAILPAPPSAPAKPERVESIGHTVIDLERSVAFYHNAFAFPVVHGPGAWRKPAGMGEGLSTPGARVRTAVLALPGTDTTLLLMEFKGVSGRPLKPRNSDAGACTLAITFKDVDRALRDARAAGGTVVTKGGEPLALGPTMRLVFVTDPDGFFVEIGSAAAADPGQSQPGGNGVSARVGFTISDSEKASNFYRNTLGMQFQQPRAFVSVKAISDLIGVDDIEFKSSFADLPGGTMRLEFLEFRGKSAQSKWGRLQDPGTPLLVLAVPDVKSAAAAIISAGGKPLPGEARAGKGAARHLFLQDPNEIPLELVKAP